MMLTKHFSHPVAVSKFTPSIFTPPLTNGGVNVSYASWLSDLIHTATRRNSNDHQPYTNELIKHLMTIGEPIGSGDRVTIQESDLSGEYGVSLLQSDYLSYRNIQIELVGNGVLAYSSLYLDGNLDFTNLWRVDVGYPGGGVANWVGTEGRLNYLRLNIPIWPSGTSYFLFDYVFAGRRTAVSAYRQNETPNNISLYLSGGNLFVDTWLRITAEYV